MPGRKHLIVIHGRSTKPSEKEKKRIVKQALVHGLERVDSAVAARVKAAKPSDLKYDFVYYGDISNRLILDKFPDKEARLSGRDSDHGNQPCEPDGFYDAGLAMLYARKSHTKAAYAKFLDMHRDRRWMDNLATVVSALGSLTGFSDEIISAATADMGAYLQTRQAGSAIRDRLQRVLKPALINGHDICLVSHSMGCIVAYDVLWKFSRMSEYREVQNTGNRVNRWLTLGNPLGEPGVRDNLYDADEHEDGHFPKDIIKDWINLSAQDDFICHDPTVKDDFRDMARAGYVERIVDKKLYNLWLGGKATNPHKFYGYLDNPKFAKEVVDWVNAP